MNHVDGELKRTEMINKVKSSKVGKSSKTEKYEKEAE